MREHEVTISYNEPRIARVEVLADDDMEAEDMAVREFEQSHPEAIDVEVEDVKEID